MSINTTTSSVGSTASTTSIGSSQSSEATKKSSADTSFKDEMNKVSSEEKTQQKEEKKTNEAKDAIADKNNVKDKKEQTEQKVDNKSQISQAENENLKLSALSMQDANQMLSNDIQQMIETTPGLNTEGINLNSYEIYGADSKTKTSFITLDWGNNLSMTESDAQFFIDLAKNNTVNAQAVINQAQMALDNGVELSQVKQNVKISETLLNAINTARETNQPLRIDFDQNVSVILRMGKDGSFAANFIPGDKAVEQYLKNNIENLKNAFDEKELPYTDLSYSNRGSKRQQEEQRNKQ